MRTRNLAAALLLPALTAGSLVAASSTADAALPSNTVRKASTRGMVCSGTVLTSKAAYANGKKVGVITLYVNNKNYGTVYGCFTHAGITARKTAPTAVVLYGWNSRTATKPAVVVSKSLRTSTKAGPVAINHVKILNHCVAGVGAVVVNGKNVQVATDRFCYVRVR